jgi:hypothetical protein
MEHFHKSFRDVWNSRHGSEQRLTTSCQQFLSPEKTKWRTDFLQPLSPLCIKLTSHRVYGAVTMSLKILFYGMGFSWSTRWFFNRRQVFMELADSSLTTEPNPELVHSNSHSHNLFPAQFCHPSPHPIVIVVSFLGVKWMESAKILKALGLRHSMLYCSILLRVFHFHFLFRLLTCNLNS